MKIKTPNTTIPRTVRWLGLLQVAVGLMVPSRATAVGHWTKLDNTPNGPVSLMLLLSDGTILGQNSFGTNSYRLTPDNGSYIHGTWVTAATPQQRRLMFSSAVLRDGKVFVAGGEYTAGAGTTAELYNSAVPPNDSWTAISVPSGIINLVNPAPDGFQGGFRDSPCVILPDGKVLVSPVFPSTNGETVIYDPAANTFFPGPQLAYGLGSAGEQSWVKLPDDSILSFDSNFHSQRYIPSLNRWIPDKDLPVQLYDINSEIGAGILLPDGRAFFLGGTGKTLFYTPTGNTSLGSWAQGPDIRDGRAARDAPAAMMVNGKILCAVSPGANGNGDDEPIYFYEYDPLVSPASPNSSFTPVASPTDPSNTPGTADTDNSQITDQTCMLDLPDGTVLYSHRGSQLYVYTPDGTPLPAGRPTIASITQNSDGSYHLTGTQLNGLSQGASFGDDAQMDSNYPLVRLSDGSGHTNYARTYNWSSTSVQTGNRPVTTEFTLPPGLQNPGNYSLVVVANGIASDPVPFAGPVWVAFGVSDPGIGTYDRPYNTLPRGTNGVPAGGTILIKGPASTPEAITITKAMTIVAIGGAVKIGHN